MGAFNYILMFFKRVLSLERDEFPFVGHGFGLILQSAAWEISWLKISVSNALSQKRKKKDL